MGVGVPYPGVMATHGLRKDLRYHKYYQWTVVFLIMQVLLESMTLLLHLFIFFHCTSDKLCLWSDDSLLLSIFMFINILLSPGVIDKIFSYTDTQDHHKQDVIKSVTHKDDKD